VTELPDIWLVRHGATEWSGNGRHTGVTDIDLTDEGRRQAAALCRELDRQRFSLVLTSPRLRARETARIAGFPDAVVDDDLAEWNYGEYEGLTMAQIRESDPGWTVFTGLSPGGETPEEVGARAKQAIARCDGGGERVLVFSHSHFLRVFTAVALGFGPRDGARFVLEPAAIAVVGNERGTRALRSWNRHAAPL
jgi:probable phosphoglycerate mutase